ncbi:MAG: hypothetical protein ACRDRA_21970 [Pseudonocardiaceae bacterium]
MRSRSAARAEAAVRELDTSNILVAFDVAVVEFTDVGNAKRAYRANDPAYDHRPLESIS